MRRLAVTGALTLAGFILGCLGGAKTQPDFFTLSPAAGASVTPVAARPELGVALGQIELPRYLDRDELVTRSGPHELEVWGGVRWGGSLSTDIQRVVADDLGRLLGTARIAVYPVEPRFPVRYRVLLDLLEFGGPRGGPVTLRARWTIAGVDGGALAVGESALEQPLASASWEDYVAAHSTALGAVARELAEHIATLP